MARRKAADGTFRKHKGRITATVRIQGFRSSSRTFDDLKSAQQWASAHATELRKQRDGGALRHDVPRMTLAQLIKEFLEDPNTQGKRYLADLSLLLAWWTGHYGSTKIMDTSVMMLREARNTLRHGRQPGTVNRYLSAMRACWNWGRTSGLVPQEKVWPEKLMLTEPRGRSRYLSDAELAQLLMCAAAHSPTMHAAVMVSVGSGVRMGELRRLRWSDVDLDGQRLRVLITKNNEARSVYLPPAVVEALRALKRLPVLGQVVVADEKGQPVSKEWIEYRWHLIRQAAGLHDFRWHDLRHSCASFLAQNGATLLEIGNVLGHKSPSVTMRYSHLVQGAPVTGHAALDGKLRGA